MVNENQVRHVRNLKSIECDQVKGYPNARTCSVIHKSGKGKCIIPKTDVAIIDLYVDGVQEIGRFVKHDKRNKYKVNNCRIEITNRYWLDGKEKMFPTHAKIYCWSD